MPRNGRNSTVNDIPVPNEGKGHSLTNECSGIRLVIDLNFFYKIKNKILDFELRML